MSERLHKAASNGDTATVLSLLDAGIDVNSWNNGTALYKAAFNGHAETVRALLQRGARLTPYMDDSCMDLNCAARRGNREVVDLLRNAGAKLALMNAVTLEDSRLVQSVLDGGTDFLPVTAEAMAQALIVAGYRPETDVVRVLVEAGAKFTPATTGYGSRVLFEAIRYNRTVMAELLMRAGATVGLNQAAYQGDIEQVCALLEAGAHPDGYILSEGTCGAQGIDETPLIWAAEKGYTEIVRLLLEKGANPDASNIHGETALIEAVEHGHRDTVIALLEGGADVNFIPYNGEAALLEAKDADMLRLLLDYGADVNKGGSDFNTKSRQHWTALMVAAEDGDFRRVTLLLERGADVNAKNGMGYTPLLLAVRNEDVDIVKALLDAGADVNVRASDDETALRLLQLWKDDRHFADVLALLEQAGAMD